MLEVDGIRCRTREEYENALKDKKIIDDLTKRYDINTFSGVTSISRELRNVSFSGDLGRKFDDEIFDLLEKYKSGEKSDISTETKVNKSSKKADIKKREDYKLDSLDADLKKAVTREIKKQNRNRSMLVIFLVLISAGCIGYFVKYMISAQAAEARAQEWAELKDPAAAQFLSVETVLKKDYAPEVVIPEILDEYKALYNKNKSLIGWVKIEDTKIDYPVMQTVNNDYYLKHNFDQQEDANGCIFLDSNCDVILGNTNYIIYGHHMNSGKMFGSLVKYGNKDFYEEHKYIQFDTIYEKGTYEVMYVFRSHIFKSDEIAFKYYQFIDANSAAEFDSAMEAMAELSLYDTGVTATYGDRLITLSTCDYQEANGRFAVVAKKID